MIPDFRLAFSWVLSAFWSLITSFRIPGVSFTPAQALFFKFFVVLALGFWLRMAGFAPSAGGGVSDGFISGVKSEKNKERSRKD